MFALAAVIALVPTADPRMPPDPRQVTESYLVAALAGKPDEAVKLAEPGKSTANPDKVKKFKSEVGVEKLALPTVVVSDKGGYALAVSEEIVLPGKKPDDARVVVVFTLKKDKGGMWLVKDIDARSGTEAAARVKEMKKAYEDAQEIPPTKS